MKKHSFLIILLFINCTISIHSQRLYEINNPQQIPIINDFYGIIFNQLADGNILIGGIDTSTTPGNYLGYNFGKIRIYDNAMNYLGVEKHLPNGNTDHCCSSRPIAIGALSSNDLIVYNLFKINVGNPHIFHLYKFNGSSPNPIITKVFTKGTVIHQIIRGENGVSHALVTAYPASSTDAWPIPYDNSLGTSQLFLVKFDDQTLSMLDAVLIVDQSTFQDEPYNGNSLGYGRIKKLSNGNFLISYIHHINQTSFKIINPQNQVIGVINTIENAFGDAIEDPNTGNILVSHMNEKTLKIYDNTLNTLLKEIDFDVFSYFMGQFGFRKLQAVGNEFAFGGLVGEMTLLDKYYNVKHFNSGTNIFISGAGSQPYPFEQKPNASIFITPEKYNLYFPFYNNVNFRNMRLPNGNVQSINVSAGPNRFATALIPLDVSYNVDKIPQATTNLPEAINYYNATLSGEPSDFVSIVRYEDGYDFSQIDVRDSFDDQNFNPVPSELYLLHPETYPLWSDTMYPWFELDENGYFFNMAVKTEDVFIPSSEIDQVLYKKTYITDFSNLNEIDIDGDGVLDVIDLHPDDPCQPMQNMGYTNFDYTNPIWKEADCDNDGFTNEEEWLCGSDPYNASSTCNLGIINEKNNDFLLYPNPTSEFLNIQSNSNIMITSAIITDMLGKKIYSTNSYPVNVSALSNGIYLIQLETENGRFIKKFLKQ